jgi:hypothetical protein
MDSTLRRRWPQFTIIHLLLVAAIVCVGAAWLKTRRELAQAQAEIAQLRVNATMQRYGAGSIKQAVEYVAQGKFKNATATFTYQGVGIRGTFISLGSSGHTSNTAPLDAYTDDVDEMPPPLLRVEP